MDQVIVSSHNSLGSDRYFDTASNTSFAFDHSTQTASGAQSHVPDTPHTDLLKGLNTALEKHVQEHYPSAVAMGVFPSGSSIVLLTVANKYSLNNFWTGRWRAQYTLDVSSGNVKGEIKVDVHYFEDGNVRLQTAKPIDIKVGNVTATEVVRQVALAEKKYQEELNKGFVQLNEGVFKGLRRQLPVTRQRVEWDKVGAYRVSEHIKLSEARPLTNRTAGTRHWRRQVTMIFTRGSVDIDGDIHGVTVILKYIHTSSSNTVLVLVNQTPTP